MTMTIKNLQSTDTIKLLLEDAYYERTSNIENSIKTANRALKMSKALGNNVYIGKSLNQLALYHMIISDFEQSKNYSKEAISYFSPINDEQGIADANYSIGSIHYKTNNYHVGLKYLLESLRIYRKYNDFPSQSKVEKAIGTIYEYMGDHDNAFKSYKSSIKIARKIPDLNLETNVCNNLSGLLLKKKRPKYAMQVIEHSIKSKKLTNDIRGLGFAIYGRGKVFFAIQEYEKAKADFLTAINIHKDTIENLGASMGLHKLGVLYYKLGRLEEAIDVLEESLQLSLKYNISMIKIKNYHILYLIYKQNGNTEKALKYLEIYLSEKEAVINTQTLKVMEDYDLINKMNKLENEAELQRVKQKNIDKKNRAEKRSVALKQQFLSIMSHEIRTPLNAITTIVSILEKKVKGENKELLDSLQFASNNLINIVNDILDFTKLDSRKAKLELDNSNLYKLCNKIANLHLNVAQSKGLDIVLENNISENQNYLIDETKMTQILSNLINNAIKFTDKGGVTISAELIEEQESYDVIKLSVKDTGEGILEKDITEIFESFSQVKPIMTRKQGGTGLGLAIVKRLVKLHGSQIKVKSKEHEGSEFYFSVKLKKAAVSKKININNNYYKLDGKQVLLAEDTPINSMLIKKLLSNWGVITDHVVNGKEAFEYTKKKTYDFILMDIHMPEMNGLDATYLIKTEPNLNKETPVFAVTADVMANEKEEGLNLFDGILWKPIEIEKFYSTLANAVKSNTI